MNRIGTVIVGALQSSSLRVLAVSIGLCLAAGAGVQAATVGWYGEQLASSPTLGEGWEPAIAADPSAPYVYGAWMQYVGSKIQIYIRTSTDGGTSFGAAKLICPSCGTGTGQYDIVMATTANGALYATYMQSNKISFTKSLDHAATWMAPITVSGSSWSDKPWIATSPDGHHIYISWTSRGNVYAVASHNDGNSFSTPLKITNETGIYY